MLRILRARFSGLVDSIGRYPLTVAFLVAAAVLTAIDISEGDGLLKYTLTCAVGAAASAAGQMAFERFYSGVLRRVLMMAVGLVLTLLFYLSIWKLSQNTGELVIRFVVTEFALLIAYAWLGVIRSRYSFSESFMALFKALFQAGFFSGILFLGCIAIIAAVDTLITPVNEDAYMHTANIAFVIVAPLILLSLIPVYPGRAALEASGIQDEAQTACIEKRTGSPKFFEVLLSYIVIPLASIFTVILLIYILLNIGGEFWTNNLLEPMLIAYTITIIVLTLLVSKLENRFAVLFRKIFPKVLIPIALFQVIASLLIMKDTGVTFGRYFVILYGVFAVFSGAVLSLLPVRKTGVIALVLIVLSAVSLIPPVDAFSVSRNSQIYTLEQTLTKNGMLQAGVVTPNGGIPDADKSIIIETVRYLTDTEDLGKVKWLPEDFYGYDDEAFYKIFGFHMYEPTIPGPTYVSVYLDRAGALPISGYDIFVQTSVPIIGQTEAVVGTFELKGKTYELYINTEGNNDVIAVRDSTGQIICQFDSGEIINRYAAYPGDKNLLTVDEATFVAENEQAAMKIIVLSAGFSKTPEINDAGVQVYVFVKIK